jgi:hypothetical protein
VDAVEEGKFRVYAISTIDEALELLTGMAAGAKQDDGTYPAETVNGRVQDRLREIAETLRRSGLDRYDEFGLPALDRPEDEFDSALEDDE